MPLFASEHRVGPDGREVAVNSHAADYLGSIVPTFSKVTKAIGSLSTAPDGVEAAEFKRALSVLGDDSIHNLRAFTRFLNEHQALSGEAATWIELVRLLSITMSSIRSTNQLAFELKVDGGELAIHSTPVDQESLIENLRTAVAACEASRLKVELHLFQDTAIAKHLEKLQTEYQQVSEHAEAYEKILQIFMDGINRSLSNLERLIDIITGERFTFMMADQNQAFKEELYALDNNSLVSSALLASFDEAGTLEESLIFSLADLLEELTWIHSKLTEAMATTKERLSDEEYLDSIRINVRQLLMIISHLQESKVLLIDFDDSPLVTFIGSGTDTAPPAGTPA